MLGWMDRLTQLNCCSVLMMKERRTKYEKQNALCKNSHMLLILVCKSIVACYIGLPVGSVSSVCSCFEKNGLLVPHSSPRATSCLPDLLSAKAGMYPWVRGKEGEVFTFCSSQRGWDIITVVKQYVGSL